MTKAELEKQLEEKQKIIDEQKRKIREQNERAKENWETVSCRLPKGTKARIKALGMSANGIINKSVLAFLDSAENEREKSPQEPIETVQEAETALEKQITKEGTTPKEKIKIGGYEGYEN